MGDLGGFKDKVYPLELSQDPRVPSRFSMSDTPGIMLVCWRLVSGVLLHGVVVCVSVGVSCRDPSNPITSAMGSPRIAWVASHGPF